MNPINRSRLFFALTFYFSAFTLRSLFALHLQTINSGLNGGKMLMAN